MEAAPLCYHGDLVRRIQFLRRCPSVHIFSPGTNNHCRDASIIHSRVPRGILGPVRRRPLRPLAAARRDSPQRLEGVKKPRPKGAMDKDGFAPNRGLDSNDHNRVCFHCTDDVIRECHRLHISRAFNSSPPPGGHWAIPAGWKLNATRLSTREQLDVPGTCSPLAGRHCEPLQWAPAAQKTLRLINGQVGFNLTDFSGGCGAPRAGRNPAVGRAGPTLDGRVMRRAPPCLPNFRLEFSWRGSSPLSAH